MRSPRTWSYVGVWLMARHHRGAPTGTAPHSMWTTGRHCAPTVEKLWTMRDDAEPIEPTATLSNDDPYQLHTSRAAVSLCNRAD